MAAILEVTSARTAARETLDEDTMDGYFRSIGLPTGNDEEDRIPTDGRPGVDGTVHVIEPNAVEGGLNLEVIFACLQVQVYWKSTLLRACCNLPHKDSVSLLYFLKVFDCYVTGAYYILCQKNSTRERSLFRRK